MKFNQTKDETRRTWVEKRSTGIIYAILVALLTLLYQTSQ